MKNLLTTLGAGMLMLMPSQMDKANAHEPVFYSTPTANVRVDQRTEVYRTHHWDHDDVTTRTHIDVTKHSVQPHSGYTTVVTNHHGCSCSACCTRTPKVGINGWPVYYPGEPVRNTLKAVGKTVAMIFCPRCRRQHECNIACPGCGCSSHIHTTIITNQPSYVPPTRTEIIIREAPTSTHVPIQRELYFSIP